MISLRKHSGGSMVLGVLLILAAQDPRPTSILGIVTDPDGWPLPGVLITAELNNFDVLEVRDGMTVDSFLDVLRGFPQLAGPIRTGGGLISGTTDGAVRIFRGIPYAAPPVGELRWRPPQPVESWEGVKAAEDFGAQCPQPPRSAGFGGYAPRPESCLRLRRPHDADVQPVGLVVTVGVERGFDPELLADPQVGVLEGFDDLRLAVSKDGLRPLLGARGRGAEQRLRAGAGEHGDQAHSEKASLKSHLNHPGSMVSKAAH